MQLRSITFIFVVLLSSLVLFNSCQKEFDPKISDEISSKDPKELSAALRVWHGVRTQGNSPAPNGSGLILDNSATEPVKAFAGRYAIFKPEVISGDVSGYYVKVDGASEYFKVDYSKPRNINGRFINPGKRSSNSFFSRMDSTGGGNVDSSIVIVIPANIQVPDTFCVTYWAYDATGNVSNPATVCIIVNNLGPDANGGWMSGAWKLTASWEDNMPHDTIIYNRWITDVEGQEYFCDNNFLDYIDNGTPRLATDSIFYNKSHLTFSSNGGQKYESDYSYKFVDMTTSNCSQIFFEPPSTETDMITGGWSFNSATNKLVIIFEFDDFGFPVQEAWEYNVIKVSNNNFIMVDNFDPTYPYYIRLQK